MLTDRAISVLRISYGHEIFKARFDWEKAGREERVKRGKEGGK